MIQKKPEHAPGPGVSEQSEPFVPPETPDPVPELKPHPAKPEAVDKGFTADTGTPPESKP
jgi:hypothetical protein